jgi:repressor LexA
MIGLTQTQFKCLNFIRAHVAAHGFSPTYDEIRIQLRLSSTSIVARMVDALEERGYLRRAKSGVRSIQLIEPQNLHAADCVCLACYELRYQTKLKIVQGLYRADPFQATHIRLTGLRSLKPSTRLFWREAFPEIPAASASQRPALPREVR